MESQAVFQAKAQANFFSIELPPRGLLQTRYIFAILVFFGHALAFADRMVLNVAIVGMVDRGKFRFINGPISTCG